MLRSLQIRDFVIVEQLELDFGSGFGALTGETGAGKSILLDALGLAMGARADSSVVRSGRTRAEISADFDLPREGEPASGLAAWLDEQGFDADEGALVLRRVVEAGGRSRSWINGAVATLAQLREIGDWLCDIHGQHAHHALLRPDAQRALLDAHAGLQAQAAAVGDAYRAWQNAIKGLRAAEAHSEAMQRERELLEWQVSELRALAFDPDEWGELNAEHNRLAHAAGLMSAAEEGVEALGEGDQAIASQLDRLAARLAELAAVDAQLLPVQELLAGAGIAAGEALHELRRYRERLELDPQRLAEVERRIGEITDAARKYRVQPEALAGLLEDCEGRLARLLDAADPVALAQREAACHDAFLALAAPLSAARRTAADKLSGEITRAMQELAMSGGRFEIALLPLADGGAHGLEGVEFQVAANPSQPLRGMAKVASGGELSRIGLAIQVITSRAAATPTLIFDEVDVGIGGGVAEIVGRMLRELGVERQVLCVTHLPQVAAQANWQWSISKIRQGEETLSQVCELDEPARIEEIARMLGGVEITERTRAHAAEMLRLVFAPG
jgi:DNA repair protein RecN (Recombination protein N)